MSSTLKAVFDCNVFLQALATPNGPAGSCVELVLAGEITLFLSPFVLEEIRKVTTYPKLVAKFKIRPERVEALLQNLMKVAVIIPSVQPQWRYERDPEDAHYVNLALSADAKLVVSRDGDLLDLMDVTKPEAADFQRRFPSLRILDPVRFLREVGS